MTLENIDSEKLEYARRIRSISYAVENVLWERDCDILDVACACFAYFHRMYSKEDSLKLSNMLKETVAIYPIESMSEVLDFVTNKCGVVE